MVATARCGHICFTLGNILLWFPLPRCCSVCSEPGVLKYCVTLAAPIALLLLDLAEAEPVTCAHLPSWFRCWFLKEFVFILFCTSHSCCVNYLRCFGRLFTCDGKGDGWFIASIILKLKAILTIRGSFMALLFSFAKCQVNKFCPLQALVHLWNR